MGAVLGLVFIVIIVAIVLGKGAVGGYDRLISSGTPARGILLSVTSYSNRVQGSTTQRRFVSRSVTIDVEVPGQAPYEVTTNLIIPSNLDRDILPGATVELRVDPRNPSRMAIVGPGAGFSPIVLGAAQFDQRAS
ncbi:MAG TPA: hypothetical protein VGO00_15930 [Kofleriaceae bacterium]|nr:hypothetical protein [Kofleriaceae bacterium]